MKVFLGGTCNGSEWRDIFTKDLTSTVVGIKYFDPVVEDWNEEAQQKEIFERENSDFCLYVITPLMTGVYSISEVVDDSNKRPEKTLFCFIEKESLVSSEDRLGINDYIFSSHQIKSLKQVGNMVKKNGGQYFENIDDVLIFLKNKVLENSNVNIK